MMSTKRVDFRFELFNQATVKYIFVRAYSDAQGALPPLGIKLKISKQNLETMPQKVNFCHSRKNFFKSLNGEN